MHTSTANNFDSTVSSDKAAALNIFEYLRELKKLQTKAVRDVTTFDQVLWVNDIPREVGCKSRVWDLVNGTESPDLDAWIEIRKPRLEAPPEVPDGLECFIHTGDVENSSLEEPRLLEVSPELLLKHFLIDDEEATERRILTLNDNFLIFEKYVEFVDTSWLPWAKRRRSDPKLVELPPAPPPEVLPWLRTDELTRFDLEQPGLEEQITIEIDRRMELAREELVTLWRDYVELQWKPWAIQDRRLKKVQSAYNLLFSIYQKQQKLGEQYETVFCFGLLAWNAPHTKSVKRHVIEVQASIEFDASKGILTVGPSPDLRGPNLEVDFLEISDLPSITDLDFVKEQVRELANYLWDQARLYAALSAWVNSLAISEGDGIDTRGVFIADIEPKLSVSQSPVLSLAPALILRRRSAKGMVDFLGQILEKLKSDESIPQGLLPIVGVIDDRPARGDDNDAPSLSSPDDSDSEVYFPLSANNEQREIVRHLGKGPGVLVQGPPGTGKSHTIANLICHFLATGKKILVTSQTPRALQSLRSKFDGAAEPLSALAVVLLGNDEEGFRELERSVLTISNRRVQWNESENRKLIRHLQDELGTIRSAIQVRRRELRELREHDVYEHAKKFGVFDGTTEEIARKVKRDEGKFGWLCDPVNEVLHKADFGMGTREFVMAWRQVKPHLLPLGEMSEDNSLSVPSPENVEKVVNDLQEISAHRLLCEAKCVAEHEKEFLKRSDAELSELSVRVAQLRSHIEELYRHVFEWVPTMVRHILAEQDRTWRHLLDRTLELVEGIENAQCDLQLTSATLDELTLRNVRSEVVMLLAYLKEKGSLGLSIFRPRRIRHALQLLSSVTLSKAVPDSEVQLNSLLTQVDLKLWELELRQLWAELSPLLPGSLKMLLAAAGDYVEPLQTAFSLLEEQRRISLLLKEQFLVTPPRWYELAEVDALLSSIRVVNLKRQQQLLDEKIIAWQTAAESLPVKQFNDLGKNLSSALSTRSVANYGECFRQLQHIVSEYTEAKILFEKARLFRQQLPSTFRAFCDSFTDDDWIGRFEQIEYATQWALADRWLHEATDPAKAEHLSVALRSLCDKELTLIGQLAEALAWSHCMSRLGEVQRQALAAWHQAVKKIGKGYSKQLEYYKREARAKLAECRSAIPAWVMPLHRVVETIPAEPETFDIAIIDEASQSGPEALLLNYIAKKVIVVGDDQQIRPEYDFVNLDDVRFLIQRHLKGVRHAESFDTNGSFFSQSELRFSRHIRLKEHFRCMPEIIQFSNTHVYFNDPIIPLRQFGSGRLEPVTRTTFVEGGHRTGQYGGVFNRAEAEAVVRQICECCEDPEFENKSMGVITLLGHRQAELIQELLIDELDSEEFEKRQLLVGSPYMFQGDERDVIFISTVDAPEGDRRCRAVTSPSDLRAYNVAASRARDVMWIFHSMTLNDLKSECLRHKLLSHALNPNVHQNAVNGIEVADLRLLAHTQDRGRYAQPEPFESWFEVDVFLDIVARGFRVIPQYRVNQASSKYRIDLVVEGLNGRMAIECDGDKWHGPYQFDQDCARERELQRCGWNFWRVRGAAYYRDSARAMEPLWAELSKAKIYSSTENSGAQAETVAKVGPSAKMVTDGVSPDDGLRRFVEVEEVANEDESLDSADEFGDVRSNLPSGKVQDITSSQLQDTIVEVLSGRSYQSIAVKALTKEVLRALGVRTRSGPRLEFEKRVKRAVGVLKRKSIVEEYRSKNLRIRLCDSKVASVSASSI